MKNKTKLSARKDWFKLQGLNLRPLPCQGSAPGKTKQTAFTLPALKPGESLEIPATYDVIPKLATHGKTTVARWVLIGKPQKIGQKSVNGTRSLRRSRSA